MNISWSDPRRKFKEIARRMAASFSPRQSAVTLPGNEAKGVLVAEEMGMVAKGYTHWYFAENNPDNARDLKQVLVQTGWDQHSTLHEDSLHTMKLPPYVDYAHIDLNGTVTADVAKWFIAELSNKFVPGAIVCLTQEFCWRYNKWLRSCRKEINDNHREIYNEFRYQHLLLGENKIDYYVTFPPFLVASLLRDWQINVLEPYRYSDTIDMVLFRFVVIRRQNNPVFPKLTFPQGVLTVTKTKPVTKTTLTAKEVIDAIVDATNQSPAYKSHASRKRKAYVAQRVQEGKKAIQIEAAIQAHVTRRLEAAK